MSSECQRAIVSEWRTRFVADDKAGRGVDPPSRRNLSFTDDFAALATNHHPPFSISSAPPVIFCLMAVAACTSTKRAHGSGSCSKLPQTPKVSIPDLHLRFQISCGKASTMSLHDYSNEPAKLSLLSRPTVENAVTALTCVPGPYGSRS